MESSNVTEAATAARRAKGRTRQPSSVSVSLKDETAVYEPTRMQRHHAARADWNTRPKSQLIKNFDIPILPVGPDTADPEFDDDEYHYRKVWNIITGTRRHKHKRHSEDRKQLGVAAFFESAVAYEWCLFGASLMVFVPLYYYMLEWPSTKKFHVVALFIWLGLGCVYNAAVAVRLGSSSGVMWFTGYLLEFIFSIENVFVFHIIVKAFRAPQKIVQKAIFVVICCQIVFEMVFFMGLATRVRSMLVLPYILGIWLLYVGYHAAQDDGHEHFNVKDSSIYRISRAVFGPRLSPSYEINGSVFFMSRDGRVCVSLMFPLICCLLAVDFFLEVDVTLTKIEELPNEYIAFTSSAAAAFAVPELFFVAQDLFQRYHLLKYGVCFVLVFFGVQMLLHRFFDLPDLVGCAIIIVVMIICMIASDLIPPVKEIPHREEISHAHNETEAIWEVHGESKILYKEPAPEPPCTETAFP